MPFLLMYKLKYGLTALTYSSSQYYIWLQVYEPRDCLTPSHSFVLCFHIQITQHQQMRRPAVAAAEVKHIKTMFCDF